MCPSWLVAFSAVFKACFAVIVIPVLRRSDDININGQYKMQTADRRPGKKCGLSTKYRLQTGYKMQTENFNCFFVWYVITCHLTTYQASRNRFSVIIFHYHLHYRGIFLAHFLISFVFNKAATIVLNRISSIHVVWFSRINICVVTKYMRDKTPEKQTNGQSRKQRFAFPYRNSSVPHVSQWQYKALMWKSVCVHPWTLKLYQVEGTVLVSVRIFVNKLNT